MLPSNLNLEELTQDELVLLSKSINDQLMKVRTPKTATSAVLDRYGVLPCHRKHWMFNELKNQLVAKIPIRVYAKRNRKSTWKEYQLVYNADKTWELIPWEKKRGV